MLAQAVLLGDPAFFRIKSGSNPHTRGGWGRRKRVDLPRAIEQWNGLKQALEGQGVQVRVVPPVKELPGMVFPANAGFRFGDTIYLSNLNPARSGEKAHYRQALEGLGLKVADLPTTLAFEGEADFIPVGSPSGNPHKKAYLFTYGKLERLRWEPRPGWPPYRRVYGWRSDFGALPALESIVRPLEVLPLELADERFYHGDTILCSFGPNREYLLCYLEGLTPQSQTAVKRRFGERLVPLSPEDALAFAANSFQIEVTQEGERKQVLLMPDGLGQGVYERVIKLRVIPCPIDVSEFLTKGGGAVKCMLLDMGRVAV